MHRRPSAWTVLQKSVQKKPVIEGLFWQWHNKDIDLILLFQLLDAGKPLRQFIYSLDLGRLFVWTLRNYDQVSPLILSVDESDEISIGDMSNLVLKASKFEGEVKYLTDKADGQVRPKNMSFLRCISALRFLDM